MMILLLKLIITILVIECKDISNDNKNEKNKIQKLSDEDKKYIKYLNELSQYTLYNFYLKNNLNKFKNCFSSFYKKDIFNSNLTNKLAYLIASDNKKNNQKYIEILLKHRWKPNLEFIVQCVKSENLNALKLFPRLIKYHKKQVFLESAQANSIKIFKYIIEDLKVNFHTHINTRPLPKILLNNKKYKFLKILIKNGLKVESYWKNSRPFLVEIDCVVNNVPIDFLIYILNHSKTLVKLRDQFISSILDQAVIKNEFTIFKNILNNYNFEHTNFCNVYFLIEILEKRKYSFFKFFAKKHLIFENENYLPEILIQDNPKFLEIIKTYYPNLNYDIIKIKNINQYSIKKRKKDNEEYRTSLLNNDIISPIVFCYLNDRINNFNFFAKNKVNLNFLYGEIPFLSKFITNKDLNYFQISIKNGADITFKNEDPSTSIIECIYRHSLAPIIFNKIKIYSKTKVPQKIINDLFERAFLDNKQYLCISLAKFNPQINKLSSQKYTFLETAINKKNHNLVQSLLNLGFDPLTKNNDSKYNALELAACSDFIIFQNILKHLTPDQTKTLPIKKLVNLAYDNDMYWSIHNIKKILLPKKSLTSYMGKCILCQAIMDNKSYEFIEKLNYITDIDEKNEEKIIYEIIIRGMLKFLKKIYYNYNCNYKCYGKSILQIALENSEIAIANYLIENGASTIGLEQYIEKIKNNKIDSSSFMIQKQISNIWTKLKLDPNQTKIFYESVLDYPDTTILFFLKMINEENLFDYFKAQVLKHKNLLKWQKLIENQIIDIHFKKISNSIQLLSTIKLMKRYIELKKLIKFIDKIANSAIKNKSKALKEIVEQLIYFNLSKEKFNKIIDELFETNPINWRNVIYDKIIQNTFLSKQNRSREDILDTIFKLKTDENTKEKEKILKILIDTDKAFESKTTIINDKILNPSNTKKISEYQKRDIQNWCKKFKKNNGKISKNSNQKVKISEILAILKRACKLDSKKNYYPRDTQIISTILLIHSKLPKGRLLEVLTGEGKSTIIALFGAYKILMGKKVDVITTTRDLSKRDAEEQIEFFENLGFTVGSYNKKDFENLFYKKDIIYIDIHRALGDTLQEYYHEENVRNNRPFEVVIADETDTIMIDSTDSHLRLSSTKPGMEHLNILLARIWLFVNQSIEQLGDSNDVLHEIINQAESSTKEMIRELTPEEEKEYEEYQNVQNQIDGINKSYSPKFNEINNIEDLKLKNEKINLLKSQREQKIDDLLKNCQWHQKQKPARIKIPNHLRTFALSQLKIWANNAISAKLEYKKKIDYDVVNGKIVPIDFSNTGQYQYQTSWYGGINQFIEIKEKIPMTSITTTPSYISNDYLYNKYKEKYGVTGTLGSEENKKTLTEIYNIETIDIPSFIKKEIDNNEDSIYRSKELLPIICNDIKQFCKVMIDNILFNLNQQRSVLVINKFANNSIYFYKQLKKIYKHPYRIYLYTGKKDGCPLKNIYTGYCLIATTISGRGTDIKTNYSVEKLGGLHVIQTFLPKNLRVEKQTGGRTGRSDNNGTIQYILCQEGLDKTYNPFQNKIILQQMRNLRDEDEKQFLETAKKM